VIARAAGRGPFSEAWLLTKALVKHRALAIRRDWKSRSLYGFALALALGVFALIFAGTYGSVRVLEAASANGMIDSVPAWAFLIYLFTDILIAFGQALGDLYLSRDMPILVSMPLRTVSIIIAKFALGVAQNEVYALIFLLPFTLAYLAGLGAAWWTYPIAAAAVFVFPATLYAPLIVVTIAALRAIPAKIAKEGLWIIGASVPTIFWFLSFYRVAHLSGNVATMRLPTPPDWLPSTWIGDAISMLAQGNREAALTWLSLLAMATFVACPVALIIVSRSFGKGWSSAISLPARRRVETGAPREPSTPVAALIRKDALMFLRSPQLWFNHLTALAFVVFLLVGHTVQTPLLPLTPQLAMVQIGFVAVFGALNPGMTALSLEHLGVWVLRSAPLSARQILRAKFVVACGQAAAVAAISAAALAFGYGFSAFVSVAMIAFAIGASASSISVGIAFDAAFPNFSWENPNHINRGLRMVIPFISNTGTLLVCAIVLFGARFAIASPPIALGAGLAACVGVQIFVSLGTLHRARRDIAALEV
jgi:ABC-2 type transport system permease protein